MWTLLLDRKQQKDNAGPEMSCTLTLKRKQTRNANSDMSSHNKMQNRSRTEVI